jgi:hypothetical protein
MRYTNVQKIVSFREKRFLLGDQMCSIWGALKMNEIHGFHEVKTRP